MTPRRCSPTTARTTNSIDNNPIGWSTSTTQPYFGGLAFAPQRAGTNGPFVFVTDMLTGNSTPNDTRGLIRFDQGNKYSTAERETDAVNGTIPINGIQTQLGVNFTNVSLGLNGAIYALASPNAFNKNWAVYEFNQFDPLNPAVFTNLNPLANSSNPQPGHLITTALSIATINPAELGDAQGTIPQHIDLMDPRTSTPLTNVTSVTANENGNLYIGTNGSGLFKTDPRARRCSVRPW